MSNIWQTFIGLTALLAITGGIYYMGFGDGKEVTQSKYLTDQIKQLQAVIDDTKKLTKQAQDASTELARLISAKAEADTKSTQELTNALKATKDNRAGCVFDERIMQQINTARSRAATAASAATVDGLLPTARSNDR